METDPTEETIRKEIADAVRILREDGVHIHRTYKRFQETLTPTDPPTDPPSPKDPPANPTDPPPPKDPPANPPKKKKGIWWGDRE
jgi:hypothetical protein